MTTTSHSERRQARRRRLLAAAAAAGYVAILLLLIGLWHFRVTVSEPVQEALVLDFGSAGAGFGESAPPPAETPAETATPSPPSVSQPVEAVTQNTEEAPSLPQPQTVDRRALFPGASASDPSPAEAPAGNGNGTGVGAGGDGASLAGRSLVGSLPRPDYPARNVEGRVIMEVYVNRQGRVERAVFRPNGSTTNDSRLVDAARRAALQARFNDVDETATALQIGTITYNFRMQR